MSQPRALERVGVANLQILALFLVEALWWIGREIGRGTQTFAFAHANPAKRGTVLGNPLTSFVNYSNVHQKF